MAETQRALGNQTLSVRGPPAPSPTRRYTARRCWRCPRAGCCICCPGSTSQGGVYQVNRRRIVLTQGRSHRRRPRGRSRPDRSQGATLAGPSARRRRCPCSKPSPACSSTSATTPTSSSTARAMPAPSSTSSSKGKVEITTTDAHGEKLRLALYGDGDYFGETALLGDWRHTTTAQTLTPTVFLTLDRARLRSVLDGSPALRAALRRARRAAPGQRRQAQRVRRGRHRHRDLPRRRAASCSAPSSTTTRRPRQYPSTSCRR